MTEDYKGRIGNLIRDARKHRGLTQQQLAELLGTSQSAINRIEKGHQNLSLEMLARIGAALDSEIVALGAGPDAPAGHRPDHAVGLDRRQDLQERRRRAAVRLAAQPRAAPRCARSPGSRRSTGCSRCSTASACRPAGSTTTTTSRSSRPRELDLERDRRGRRAPYPLDHHVPRSAAAPRRRPSSCPTPAAATSAPAPSSRT